MRHLFAVLIILSFIPLMSACTGLFFQPSKQLLVEPSQFGIEYENVYFKSIDNLSLHGWWFPAEQKSRALVVFLHGNAQNVSTHASAVHWLTQHQFDVFIFDYRGYGLSEGKPELGMIMTDINQAYAYAKQRITPEQKLFVISHSLGASMAIYSLAKNPEGIDGAVFLSPFSDYQSITQHALAGSWLTWALQWPLSFTINNDYRPLNFVKQLPPIPLLYLYSDSDRAIPSQQVISLYENSHQPKFLEALEGTHNSLFEIQSNRDILLNYLNQWLNTPAKPAN